MRGRAGIAVLCSICMGDFAFGVRPSAAALPSGRSTARLANLLAKLIRNDARQRGRQSKRAVTVTQRCCGVRVLRVHYSVRTRGHVTGAYVLRLEAERGRTRGVAVSESSAEVGYQSGVKSWRVTTQYEFALHHAFHGPNGGWSFHVSYADTSWRSSWPPGASIGEGFAFECEQHKPVPTPLYRQAVVVAHKAPKHALAAPEAVLRSSCR
jgi:hypothetical protein